MASVGQIIYNLEDYNNSGGYISTSSSDVNTTIYSVDDASAYKNGKINIFQDIIGNYFSGKTFTKLGIQAPSGTRVVLNTNKVILIGRTGIYELDDDISITSMYFERPRNYTKDEDATQKSLTDGQLALQDAEQARIDALAELESQKNNVSATYYWSKYISIQDTYDKSYQEALSLYNIGINGIYTLPNSDDVNAEENYQDLFNIIIDFIY